MTSTPSSSRERISACAPVSLIEPVPIGGSARSGVRTRRASSRATPPNPPLLDGTVRHPEGPVAVLAGERSACSFELPRSPVAPARLEAVLGVSVAGAQVHLLAL